MKYIRPVASRAARGQVAGIYSQIRREFGVLGEPLTLHSPIPGLLAGVWASFRESVLAGVAPREWKEAVAVAVSRSNRCPYCLDAHAIMLSAAASADAQAVAEGRDGEIADPEIRKIVAWAAATRTPGTAILASPPFPPAYAPEILGTALWIHYINRMVTIFLGGRLIPLPPGAGFLRAAAFRIGGRYFRRTLERPLHPGDSLALVDEAALPEDLAWAAPSPPVAGSWAAFAAAAENAGAVGLVPEVRAAVKRRIEDWQGEDPDTSWLAHATGGLEQRHLPAARLALLAALAPYRVESEAVAAFRQAVPGPDALLGAVAWSSFAAARRIASFLSPVA